YWGPGYGEAEVRRAIAERLPESGGKDGRFREVTIETVADEERLSEETAAAIAAGAVVGWYQGRAEWGPRALGDRSILADPRRPALLAPDRRLLPANRRAHPPEHLVQRERADRQHPRGSSRLLSPHAHGPPGPGGRRAGAGPERRGTVSPGPAAMLKALLARR